MKKMLFIAGIMVIIACVLTLLYAAMNMFGYYRVLDGSPQLFERLHMRMVRSFIAGIMLALIGAACFFIRARL